MNRANIISTVLALLGACVAHADVHPFLKDRFVLQAGAFLAKADLNGSVDGATAGENPEFDFEGQFGVSRS